MKKPQVVSSILDYFSNLSPKGVILEDIRCDKSIGAYAFSASVKISEKTYTGYGQALSKDKAAFIAVMELSERYIVDNFQVKRSFSRGSFLFGLFSSGQRPSSLSAKLESSNGVAIHEKHSKAIEGAVEELIERHVILKALCESIFPIRLSQEIPSFLPTNIKIDSFVWAGPLGKKVVITRCEKGGRHVYGFGCSNSTKESLQKSYLEVLPRALLLSKFSSSDSPLVVPNKNVLFHWYEESAWTDAFFTQADSVGKMPLVDAELSSSNLWLGEIDLKNSVFGKVGLKAYVASSEKLQPLFSGKWDPSMINADAISIPNSLPPDMHMIG